MTNDACFLNEIWGAVAPHIPKKERFEIAQQLVEIFDDNSMADGFEFETEFDGDLKAAVVAHFELDEQFEDEEEDDYYE